MPLTPNTTLKELWDNDFVVYDETLEYRIIQDKCPRCGALMFVKDSKDQPNQKVCSYAKCGYRF